MPPTKRITTRSDVNPFGAESGVDDLEDDLRYRHHDRSPTVTSASHVIMSRGAYENDRTPRRAHARFRMNEFVTVPNGRSGRTYGTPVCRSRPTLAGLG